MNCRIENERINKNCRKTPFISFHCLFCRKLREFYNKGVELSISLKAVLEKIVLNSSNL